jgi:hypothetical protein
MRGMTGAKKSSLLLLLLLLLLPDARLPAQETIDLPALIGLSLEEACRRLGAPAQVYSLRAGEQEQDDVVFYYPAHLYLFWYQNRVWQARADGRFGGTVFSLSMGDSRERVLEVMGKPVRELEDSLVFHIEDRGYPVQAGFYFEKGVLSDVYCFRGDL